MIKGAGRHPLRRVLILAALLGALLVGLPHAAPLFHALFPQLEHPLYARIGFATLTLAHTGLVLLAGAIDVLIGVGLGIAVTRRAARDLQPTAQAVAVIGQTFPPVAVLVLAVPLLGYGAAPTLLALVIYGALPVLGQTIAGLRSVPPELIEAADGMGFGRWRRLREVELPLALAPIMAGVRISIIISVGTATLGSTVGANTLGSPIVEGLVGDNNAYVIQGVLLVAVLALLIDALLGLLESWLRRGPDRSVALGSQAVNVG